MSYLPDTTSPIKKDLFGKHPDEPNPYYEGLLNLDKQNLIGIYDSIVQEAANALDNFDVCLELASNICEDDGKSLNETISPYELTALERPEVQRYIKLAILQYMELSRNDMVVAALDDQCDDAEYHEKVNQLEKDFKELSEEEFIKKYPLRETYINTLD